MESVTIIIKIFPTFGRNTQILCSYHEIKFEILKSSATSLLIISYRIKPNLTFPHVHHRVVIVIVFFIAVAAD